MLTNAQRVQRKGRITSSVIGAVLDLDPFSSPYDAALRIMGDDDFAGSPATRRGEICEPGCMKYAADETGLYLASAPFVAHEDWSGDSTDGLLLDENGRVRAVVEAKTVSLHAMTDEWGEEGTDDIPEKFLAQCHWHLLHHPEASTCYVPVLFGGDFILRLYEVPRDTVLEATLRQTAKAWHTRHIKNKEPVPIGASHADKQRLQKQSPRDWDNLKPWDDALGAIVEQRIAADKQLKAAQKEVDRLSNVLREKLGDHGGMDASSHGYSVTYRKNQDGTRTDWQQVAREMGASEELIYRHTQVVPGTRVLRVAKRRCTSAAQKTFQEKS